MDFSGDDQFSKKVDMYYDDRKVKFGNAGQNLAVIAANINGKKIEMSDGGDSR